MSKITGIISAALGLALVKRFTDSIKDEPTTAPIIPKQPKQMVLGPAGGTGFNIFPQGVPEGLKITQQQLAAFTPERKVTIPKYDPTLPVAQPIATGKTIPLGLREGEAGDDLIRRLFR